MKITIPNNNIEERTYIINQLLGEFLNISFTIEVDKQESDYVLNTQKKDIVIKDMFFSKHNDTLSYLSLDNIPNNITTALHPALESLPIIFGEDTFEENENRIICGIDIFANAFFMLTRWEEFLLGREEKGKCSENELLCVKNRYEKRAIVNEYLVWLEKIFQQNNVEVTSNNLFQVKLTHDVDRCYVSSWGELAKNLIPLAFKQKQYKKVWKTLKNVLRYKIFRMKPFMPFDELMDFSDKYNLQNEFYFKACHQGESGYTYAVEEDCIASAIKNVIKRNHIVGFHPSETTFNNDKQYEIELERLCSVSGGHVSGGRNHGLYYNVATFRQWDKYLKFDSGFGYQHRNGFRCGVCYPFHVFDIFHRQKLDLIEYPFVLMDSVALRNNWSHEEHLKDAKKVIDVTKKYNGVLCINWHSNQINALERKSHKPVYFNIIKYATE